MENIETLLAAVAQSQGLDDAINSAPEAAELANSVDEGRVPPVTVAIERRKRGRPPKGLIPVKSPPPKRKKLDNEDEDVCFICFDGGSLVLCDRKGCPKAYHPACIKRDESFFKSKAKWNCGWHICSVCRKSSHYLCYTCTYSLCKGCTKDTDYVAVRGTKGFCATCMKMIMLIENKDQVKNEPVQVDFDDKLSWEYLFKVYWVILKEKLSLTLTEITEARPPLHPMKSVPVVSCKPRAAIDWMVSDSSVKAEYAESNVSPKETTVDDNGTVKPNTHKVIDEPTKKTLPAELTLDNNGDLKLNSHKVVDEPIKNMSCAVTTLDNNGAVKSNVHKVIDAPIKKDEPIKKGQDKPRGVEENNVRCVKELDKTVTKNQSEWASKELMDFATFVRKGDKTSMSPFDAQKLLLNYIKKNNLRDPRQKSQIVCDHRLKILFGKPRVGHIEMLKLLEFHFPATEESQNNSLTPAGFITSDVKINGNGNINNLPTSTNGRKRKMRKKPEARTPNNLNDYAAIDVHNINLIYLRRYLMEIILEDQENFKSKVIGSMVRIRTASNEQKQDFYRLVQVVGMIRAAESYKIGEKTTNVMLEVLNLYKKEVVSIDAISNQEFTEDECRRLRQSIRCGLVKQLTVGEVQKIALALQPTRVNDWLESEELRLTHLRDRASENGRKKELREYVERLEVLKSPEEKHRRLSQIPEIHTDPKMSPYYESDEDYAPESEIKIKKVAHSKSSYSGIPQSRRNLAPVRKGKKEPLGRSQNKPKEKIDAGGTHCSQKPVNITNLEVNGKSASRPIQKTMQNSSASIIETEKVWHYRDPQGKIQGPFSMMELRIWNKTGLFPLDMKIWTNHEQDDSVLLTDALIRHLPGASEMLNKQSSVSTENGVAAVVKEYDDVKVDFTDSSSSPQCWDLTNDGKSGVDDIVNEFNLRKVVVALPALSTHDQKKDEFDHSLENFEKRDSNSETKIRNDYYNENGKLEHNEEDLRSANMELDPKIVKSETIVTPVESSRSLDVCSGSHLVESNVIVDDPIVHTKSNEVDLGSDIVKSRIVAPMEARSLDVDLSSMSVEPMSAVEPTANTESLDIDFGSKVTESKSAVESTANVRSSDMESKVMDLTLEECEANVAPIVDARSLDMDVGSNLIQFEANVATIANSGSLDIDLDSTLVESEALVVPLSTSPKSNKGVVNIDIVDLPSPTPTNVENEQPALDNLELMTPMPTVDTENQPSVSGFMEFTSPMPRSNIEDVTEAKQPQILDFPDSGPRWIGSCNVQISDTPNDWCGFSPTPPEKPSIPEWDSSLASATTSISDGHQISQPPVWNTSNWMEMVNEQGEMIVIDALGEEYLSEMLAEIDARGSQATMNSPDAEFRRFFEDDDCKDDCFSSIEDFNRTSIGNPPMCDASCSTGDIQMTSQSSCNPIGMFDGFDSIRKSSVNSSASSEDALSEVHPMNNHRGQELVGPSPISTGSASASTSDGIDPGWGNVQGNINLVTVHGNVNLVLGGPGHGIDWGPNNPGMGWAGPSLNGGLLPWCDGPQQQQQRKYGNVINSGIGMERWAGETGGFGRGRLPPRGRSQAYGGGGGYARPTAKRVCKFFESGHCKKGVHCDYLHQ